MGGVGSTDPQQRAPSPPEEGGKDPKFQEHSGKRWWETGRAKEGDRDRADVIQLDQAPRCRSETRKSCYSENFRIVCGLDTGEELVVGNRSGSADEIDDHANRTSNITTKTKCEEPSTEYGERGRIGNCPDFDSGIRR